MTLTELKCIVAVARERHFGRAAEACHVSQKVWEQHRNKQRKPLIWTFTRQKADAKLNVQIEGRAAFGASRSNAGLGVMDGALNLGGS